MRHSYEQSVTFQHEQSGARAIGGVDLSERFVSVRIGLLDDVDLACAADRVDPMPFAVIEDFIGIAGDIDLCNDLARVRVEDYQL